MTTRRLLLAILVVLLTAGARPAVAFRACTQKGAGNPPDSGHWPDPANTNLYGTQKWDFDWKVDQDGIELDNVRYTAQLGQPKKLVLRRASLPFLPVHYAENAPDCPPPSIPPTDGAIGFNDQLTSGNLDGSNPFCCYHVPTTVCNLPDRPQACMPTSGVIASCPANAISCTGVCVGTQVDTGPTLEDGTGEIVSGSSTADVLLSATFRLGGYQFVQRWRLQDDGTIRPSVRAGGVHYCQWHNHEIYWRFHFDLADIGTPAAVVQQCDAGGCPDLGATGWSANLACTCGNRPGGQKSWWRISDKGVAGRAVIVQTNAQEGDPAVFCENTTSQCGGAGKCVNNRDFCALGATEPRETFTSLNCNDQIPQQITQPACAGLANGGDVAFWYFGHINHHDPCKFLPMCDPALGSVAFGPTIRLVGAW